MSSFNPRATRTALGGLVLVLWAQSAGCASRMVTFQITRSAVLNHRSTGAPAPPRTP